MSKLIHGGISYSGFVKISVMKGNRVIKTITEHNAGTTWLFKLLSSVLCGNDESFNMPKYFDLGNIISSDNIIPRFISNIANRIPLSAKVINNFLVTQDKTLFNGSYGAVFTAMIPSIQVIQNTSVEILRLYSTANGGDEVLIALVELPPDKKLELDYSLGYNYMIEWVMTFENALLPSSTITI